ncbi:unnamed protein product [Protopolystoma xenopodis]|uniref:Uncharacterized protein n=1 Tax=Protopolystoma xenopodis TaxID=117903 RepID=A0A3S5AZQ9_9PLAT|nr:unnamed protein product [Protopolystoma xenopodis]
MATSELSSPARTEAIHAGVFNRNSISRSLVKRKSSLLGQQKRLLSIAQQQTAESVTNDAQLESEMTKIGRANTPSEKMADFNPFNDVSTPKVISEQGASGPVKSALESSPPFLTHMIPSVGIVRTQRMRVFTCMHMGILFSKTGWRTVR